MSSKYIPIHRSAQARLHIRNFGTVNSERCDRRTTRTATFPMTANDTTIKKIKYHHEDINRKKMQYGSRKSYFYQSKQML